MLNFQTGQRKLSKENFMVDLQLFFRVNDFFSIISRYLSSLKRNSFSSSKMLRGNQDSNRNEKNRKHR